MSVILLENKKNTIKLGTVNRTIKLSGDKNSIKLGVKKQTFKFVSQPQTIKVVSKKENIKLKHTGLRGPQGPIGPAGDVPLIAQPEQPEGTELLWIDTDAVDDSEYDSIVDNGTSYIFAGDAMPGTAPNSSGWRISRTSKATLETRWANSTSNFVHTWDLREGYSY